MITQLLRRVVVTTAIGVVVTSQPATASWQDTTSAAMSIASGSLAAATGLGATAGCALLVPEVALLWVATTSPTATGYRVFRRVGTGSYSQIATVPGPTANSYVDTPVVLLTSYTYYVQAYVASWTADTGTVAVTSVPSCV